MSGEQDIEQDKEPDEELQTTLRLIVAAQGEDREALEELFNRYAPRVRRIVALRLDCPIKRFAEFDDVVQETLLKAFTGLESFRTLSVGAFRNWLATCAENTIRDLLRRRGAQRRGADRARYLGELGEEELHSSIFAGGDASPSQEAMGKELEERVEAALLELGSRHREIIILRKLCELSDQEIATRLGFGSAATVRSAYHRAISKLEERLASSAS